MPAPRMEFRAPAKTTLKVSLLESPDKMEILTVEDVSRHGARVVGSLLWHEGDRILAKTLKGNFAAHGRVVYCKPMESSPGHFAVGLEFFSPTGTWEE